MDPQVLAYLPLISPVVTLVAIFGGILFSNRHVDVRISDLQRYIDARIGTVDQRMEADRRYNDSMFKMILEKLDDIETRFAR
jgi:hypothetical protein